MGKIDTEMEHISRDTCVHAYRRKDQASRYVHPPQIVPFEDGGANSRHACVHTDEQIEQGSESLPTVLLRDAGHMILQVHSTSPATVQGLLFSHISSLLSALPFRS